jgi:hypothetical protein
MSLARFSRHALPNKAGSWYARASDAHRRARDLWLKRLLPAALLASSIALFNRFPLTYADSGNYLENAFDIAHGRTPWLFYRPVFYGGFLTPFASPQTIWLLPILQSLFLAFTVDQALRVATVPVSTLGFLALFAGLSTFTSLSWFSGQIMPDVFTSAVILLCFVFIWGAEHQTRRARCLVGALLTFAIATHLSHLPLYAMLALTMLAWRMLTARGYKNWRRWVPLTVSAVAPLITAVGLLVGSNYYVRRELALSRSSSLYALAHLVGHGLVQRYLARVCPTERYQLCSERSSLQANLDWVLWDPRGPWKRHEPEVQRGDSTFLREATAIVRGTLRQEWPAEIGSSLRNTVVQLGTFGIHPGELTFSNSVAAALRRLGPGTLAAYMSSRQVQKTLPLKAATLVQYGAVVAAVLVLLVCLPALRNRPLVQALTATVWLGVVLNAMLIASMAMVHPRYQSRVIWLLPLIGIVAALEAARVRRETRCEPQLPAAG